MTKFDAFKSKNIDELADWLDEFCCDGTLWLDWFGEKYCQNCPAVMQFAPALNRNVECAYCEVHHKCKLFPDFNDTPSSRDIAKMWLESEEEKV